MTVIFATYHNFLSNSSIQVFSLANRMAELGHRVHVCIPDGKKTITSLGVPKFACHTYDEALQDPQVFLAEPGDLVIHTWTPRENVRQFTEKLQPQLACPVVVHLEDNEDTVTASLVMNSTLRQDRQYFLSQPDELLDAIIPGHLSHPSRFRAFLTASSGVTMLIDKLAEFVPPGKPSHLFWPAHNDEIFRETPLLREERRSLGVKDDETVLTYVGNVTSANRQEVASLYLAVVILRRLGYPTRLVRAGRDCAPLFEEETEEMSEAVISLGQLDHTEMPRLMAMADFLVQPGQAGPYNDYRFPSKLPEFFSVGRPVLLPHSNLGFFVRDGIDAVVLREGNSMEIAERIIELLNDPDRYEQLRQGALAFSGAHFDWRKKAQDLIRFYSNLKLPPLVVANPASEPHLASEISFE